ncbi:hypothetical protein B0G76_7485 [Paraburkholderia sp. BL23I1N1]|uniref:hypothetical protein n=1 Tax=Paraburkholderia sp. BL23I1N1 TaxID=1938802 RepID=UPI000E70D5F0|nr:hypothetical protein [Paraburkholderia sp. BL23I1N1]RKE25911.1 hypothetical protein B0G76_7485 [Paraburkholderia sp. BL23I1N1]
MSFTYSKTAKQRIAQQGVSSITAFLEEVPLAVRKKVIANLPAIPGFRKNSATEFKKQFEKLAGAIGHAPDEKFRATNSEWQAFGLIWAWWANERFSEAFPKGPYNFADISEKGALEFVRNLVEGKKSGCAREDIERLVLFSGLPTTDAMSALVDALPLRVKLERDRALAKLPEDVAGLQLKVSDIGRATEKLVQDMRTTVAEATAASSGAKHASDEIEDIKRKLSELHKVAPNSQSKEMAAITDNLAAQTKHFDSHLKMSLDAWQASESDLRSKTNALQKSVSALASEMSSIRTSLASAEDRFKLVAEALKARSDVSTVWDEAQERGPTVIAGTVKWVNASVDAEPVRVELLEAILRLVHENFIAAGVRSADADRVARTVVSATLAGQLIQYCGSLADVLGFATATSLGAGKALSWQVPLGLCDGVDVDALLKKAAENVPKTHALLLRGVNRSAFEIYGTGIRDVVLQRQFSRRGEAVGQIGLIATWADGPATLPGGSPLVELGPVVDSDSLTWATSADFSKIRTGEIAFEQSSIRDAQSAIGEEIAEVMRMVDAVGLPQSRFWRMAFLRFVNILFVLPGSTYAANLSIALSAWVLPWAKAKGVARETIEGAINSCAAEQLKVASVRSALDELLAEAVA